MSDIDNLHRRLYALEELVGNFFSKLDNFGLEAFRKFYGTYRAFVADNADPEQRGRIKAYSPDLGQSRTNFPDVWIDPAFAGAGTSRGTFAPPEIGDCVRLFFATGEASQPIMYVGGWHGSGEVPSELAYASNGYPERRGFVTRMGHAVSFNDESGSEEIRIAWHKASEADAARTDKSVTADRSSGETATITFNSSGITITDKDQNKIQLNGGNCEITLSSGFTVTGSSSDLSTTTVNLGSGASASAVLGEQLLTYLQTHTHPTGVGPSGPPIVPPTSSLLSTSVKLKP